MKTYLKRRKQTHIGNQRFIRRHLHQYAMNMLNLSNLQYFNIVFESGLIFLDEQYPEKEAEWLPFFQKISQQRSFWLWWKNEWNVWMFNYLKDVNDYFGKTDIDAFFKEVVTLIHADYTYQSYINYLKLSNEKLFTHIDGTRSLSPRLEEETNSSKSRFKGNTKQPNTRRSKRNLGKKPSPKRKNIKNKDYPKQIR